MSNTAPSDKEKTRIYLDYSAATPTDPDVLVAMQPYWSAEFGNASSLHTSGRRAKRAIENARASVAGVLGCSPEEIIFTGSGTESDNLGLFGAARANRARGNHIIISAVEHKAVIEAAAELKKDGFEVSIAPVDEFGMVDVDACLALITPQTTLISVMYANNEVGTIEPIQELSKKLPEHIIFHTDACQAAGLLPLDVAELGVDLMTLNGSKVYGPRGVGLLYKKKGLNISPVIVGGEQERSMRAGTESVPLIMGFAAALQKAETIREVEAARLAELRDYFTEQLLEKIPGATLNGHPTERLPNNVHVSIPNVEGEALLLMLDAEGIEASTGSACSAFDLAPSHVLLALGQTPELAHGSIRFSLGRYTTKQEIDRVLDVFPAIVARLTQISSLTARL